MLDRSRVFQSLPSGLRTPLVEEYNSIVQNFSEQRWTPAELSGGKFCEIVYTILDGHAKGSFPSKPGKPAKFVDACKKLESNAHVPRSFQILIPRLLPALYEIRNNRNVGHVGGDVDPNFMDSTAVLGTANWIMAELVRVFHSVSTPEAQAIVNALTERRVPLVWQFGDIKRVLNPKLALRDQILVLLASSVGAVQVAELQRWTEAKNLAHFRKTLRGLHKTRLIELSAAKMEVQLLPPGSKEASRVVAQDVG
jgi:hypothetical protein